MGCYKVILDCAEANVSFYEKCGLTRKEVQMVGASARPGGCAGGRAAWVGLCGARGREGTDGGRLGARQGAQAGFWGKDAMSLAGQRRVARGQGSLSKMIGTDTREQWRGYVGPRVWAEVHGALCARCQAGPAPKRVGAVTVWPPAPLLCSPAVL